VRQRREGGPARCSGYLPARTPSFGDSTNAAGPPPPEAGPKHRAPTGNPVSSAIKQWRDQVKNASGPKESTDTNSAAKSAAKSGKK
jgi:hypothetical protein